jgi:hypothetical protein
MCSQQSPAEPQNPTDPLAGDALYYRRVLHELIDTGAEFARVLRQQVETRFAGPDADAAPETAIAFATAFERIARAVRRTITLARKVAEPVAEMVQPAQHRAAARRRIIREVEDTIQRMNGDSEAETLRAEFLDRLDGPDLDDDIQLRPVADIIADICRDLGLAALPGTHPWKRRTVADLTALCARAAMPRAERPADVGAVSDPPGDKAGASPSPCTGVPRSP